MPTLVLTDVPERLFDEIQRLANERQRSAADTAVEVLETALCSKSTKAEPPLPRNGIFMTEEITAPFTLPRPEGKLVKAVRVEPPLPTAHDIPDEE